MNNNDINIYYTVDNRRHQKKLSAIIDANSTNSDVKWHFYDHIFQKNDWVNEPTEDLNDLYFKQAKNIREKYDYVVLLCSGGADSTNMLYSFLLQGLLVDEVIISAPLSGLSNFNYNQHDTSHRNTISETKFAQLPLAHELTTNYPKIKVTLNDYFENILNYVNESWVIECDDWMHPSSASRYRFQEHKHLVSIAGSGKKLAFVYGIDKPNLFISNKNVYLGISDLAVNVMRPPFDNDYPNAENVMFYWDPDNIKCITKQAHIVARNIFSFNNPILKYVYDSENLPSTYEMQRFNQSKYERGIVPYIYSLNKKKVFQAEKPSKLFLGEHDHWFYDLHGTTMSYQMMLSETSTLLNTINPRHLNPGLNGFKVNSKWYKIGTIAGFKNKF